MKNLGLALEFLDAHPDAAVRILEQYDAHKVDAFLDTIPDAYSTVVLQRTLPAFAAHLCRAMGAEQAARLLQQQSVARMVAVLRHLDPGEVEAILDECTRSRRQACVLLLHYPVHCTGAWIVPNTAVVSSDFTVAEVLGFLKDATEETFSKFVFVVSRAGIPEGRVNYLALLKARQDVQVGRIMENSVDVISGQMLLAQAEKLPCWQEGDVMPVVGAQQQFIGVLRHVDLRRGLQQDRRSTQQDPAGSDPLTGIFDVYGRSLLALFHSISNAVDTDLKS